MNPEQWRRARQLFDDICDVDQHEQQRRLVDCSDNEIVALVQQMLISDAQDRMEDQLALQTPQLAQTLTQSLTDDRIGQALGNYQITRQIGQGGMGYVYQAQRTDGSYQQQVAIKFVAMPSLEQTARFKRERQLLARLTHPNIARLLDGGVDHRDIPYLVMEYVDGQQIDRYCDQQRFTIERRLKLFLAVLSGVCAAHRQLIIHRDLKPSNIMVDGTGQPKLLDFGIGKLLEPDLPSQHTLTHQPLFSPQYAAPEQIQGEPVGTHTDVFQLGLLLDELISGTPVRATATNSVEAMVRMGLSKPEAPATRLARSSELERIATARQIRPQRLLAKLRGDLRWIVNKACAMDPVDRYGHVDDLADDIRHYLSGQPVAARQPSTPYLIGKFIRRHRFAVASASIALTLLLSALVVSIRQTLEAQRQRELAQQQSELAQHEALKQQQVKDFLLDLFHDVDPSVTLGEAITTQTVLDQAAARIEQGRYETDIVAALNRTIGDAYMGLGLLNQAERHLMQAKSDFESLQTPHSEDYADTLFALAELHTARVDDQAREYHEAALAVREAIYPEGNIKLAQSLLGVARANRLNNDREQTIAIYQRALSVIERKEGRQTRHYADALGQLASFYGSLGEFSLGLPVAAEAVDVARASLDPRDPLLASLLSLLGTLQSDSGQFAPAQQNLAQALSLYSAIFSPDHPKALVTRANLASLHLNLGQFDQALMLAKDHHQGVLNTFGGDSSKAVFALDLIGEIHFGAGEYQQALNAHDQAWSIQRKLGQQNAAAHRTRLFRGRSLLRLGHIDGAIVELEIVVNDTSMAQDSFQVAAMVRLAEAKLEAEQTDAALNIAVQARQAARRMSPVQQADAAVVWARSAIASGDLDSALPVLDRVIVNLKDNPLHRAVTILEQAQQLRI